MDTTKLPPLPPLPPNASMLTSEQTDAVRERHYPKWLYRAGEEPIIVETPEIEAALGTGWRDTPVESDDKPAVKLPKTRAEYYRLSQDEVLEILGIVTDEKKLKSMRSSEITHPLRPGGRPKVLAAFDAMLEPLEEEQKE